MTSTIRSILISGKGSACGPGPDGLIRLDRCLANVELYIEEQKACIRQGALFGLNTATNQFNLEKTHLLQAILCESRERVTQNLDAPTT